MSGAIIHRCGSCSDLKKGVSKKESGVLADRAKGDELSPWEPVDAAFKGCSEGVCGMRGRNPQAVVEPGAKIGDLTYCPVSGAVFRIKESTQRVDVHGKTLYLCCEGCARYFAQNQERVLALRRLSL